MSRRRSGDWFSSTPKKPPPEHGIRMKRAGTTWWGQRWLAALEQALGADAGRLARGRTYARAGRAHDLQVEKGRVTAKVTGSRTTPYEIVIQLPTLDEPTWARAIAGLAEKAQFSAALLGGQIPEAIDEVFRAAGASLFPKTRADLQTSCSCPDWGDPCKHVAATYYVLGEALDRDPFLLFELRGQNEAQLTTALRAARGGATELTREADLDVIPAVKLGKLTAADYDKPREPLPSLKLGFEAPATHGALLRQLGAPGTWSSDATPAEVFAPRLRAAAENARRIATRDLDAPDVSPPTEKPPRKPRPKRGR
jgi:uncharacterized Zn finger protein